MYRGHTIGVVVPAYNEEGFVGDTIESVPAYVDRVYVIDDGSTDGTWREIREHAAAVNERWRARDDAAFATRVVPIQHDANRGVGGAIKTGYQRARDEGIDAAVVMGGDGQMRPEALSGLLDPIVEGRADYVKGNRLLGRTERGDMPAFRFAGNAILGALTKIASGYWESGDPQSGYTAISRRALEEAHVDEMYEFYGYCNDLLVKLNVAGMRVVDVPIAITYGDEKSHIAYRTYMPRVSWMLLRNFLWRLQTKYLLFDFHPLVVLYAVGALGLALGVAGFAWALPGVGTTGTPLLRGALAAVMVFLGALSLVGAMVLDARENAHLNHVEDGTRSTASPPGQADTRETVTLTLPADVLARVLAESDERGSENRSAASGRSVPDADLSAEPGRIDTDPSAEPSRIDTDSTAEPSRIDRVRSRSDGGTTDEASGESSTSG